MKYLERKEIYFTHRLNDRFDVLFTLHWMAGYEKILTAIRHNPEVRLVHRIDGSAEDYGRNRRADKIQRKINKIADLTIFQSHYCHYSTRMKFPVIVHDGPIIPNPVDVTLFRKRDRLETLSRPPRVVCATWSTNPRKGASTIYAIARLNQDINFVLCGRYPDAPRLQNIHVTGVLGREDLASMMRSCEVLLFPSENEACPNVVLEGLASGLPVLYKDSGATPEIVGNCGLPVEIATFRQRFDQIIESHEELSLRARARAVTMFSPDGAFSRYLAEIQLALKRPLTLSIRRRKLLAWNPTAVSTFYLKESLKRIKSRLL